MIVWAVLFGIVGLCVGSFLTVVIDRVPSGRSVVGGRSHCDRCDETLGPFELVPVLSYLVLRGRCRKCQARIDWWLPVVELATGTAFGLETALLPAAWLGSELILSAALVALAVIDLREGIVPRKIVWVAGALFVVAAVTAAVGTGNFSPLASAGIGAGCSGAFFLFVHLAWRGAMGFGDVRLAFLVGAGVGLLGLLAVVLAAFVTFVAAGVCGIAMLVRGAGRKATVPFVPFMAFGALVVVIGGEPLLDAAIRHLVLR